ncbi:MAG: LEPR-XLL domain-containing protein, partial [Puniceicoccaceae bacterium]
MRSPSVPKNAFELESLEPRLLLSGEGVLAGAGAHLDGTEYEPMEAIHVEDDRQLPLADAGIDEPGRGIFDLEDEAISCSGEASEAVDSIADGDGPDLEAGAAPAKEPEYLFSRQGEYYPELEASDGPLLNVGTGSSLPGEQNDSLLLQELENSLQPRAPPAAELAQTGPTPGDSSDAFQQLSEHEVPFNIGDMAARLKGLKITGVTIITHGFQMGFEGTVDLILKAFPDITPTIRAALESVAKASGDAMWKLAEAIYDRITGHENDKAWILDYDIPSQGGEGVFDYYKEDEPSSRLPTEDEQNAEASGHVILLYDWAVESNEPTSGWTEAAGDALFSMLAGLGFVEPEKGKANDTPLHFIAHSFGSAVTSQAIERLASYDVPVDQVTLLDPHDFDQISIPIDELQGQAGVGLPQFGTSLFETFPIIDGYGATIWDNVAFADVYYQTRNASSFSGLDLNDDGVPDGVGVPGGRPIPGAYNVLMDPYLPVDFALSEKEASGDHSWVWEDFYIATIKGKFGEDLKKPGIEVSSAFLESTGYALSHVAKSQAGESGVPDRPDPVFFGSPDDLIDPQSHRWTPDVLVNDDGTPSADALRTLGLTEQQFTEVRWTPRWDPLTIGNGDFETPPAEPVLSNTTNIEPGWSHHGGGGTALVEPPEELGLIESLAFDLDSLNHYLVLKPGSDHRTHNWLYIPSFATEINFQLRTVTAGDDVLEVTLVPVAGQGLETILLYTEELEETDSEFRSVSMDIRDSTLDKIVGGGVYTLRVSLVDASELGGDAGLQAEVYLDDISFGGGVYTSGRTGDVLVVDVSSGQPVGSVFNLTRIDGYTVQQQTEGKWLVLKGGELFGTLFTDLEPENPFAESFTTSGIFYFAPSTTPGLNDLNEAKGFQGFMTGTYQVNGGDELPFTIAVDQGYSQTGGFAVTSGSSALDTLRVQQRLNYLGFPSEAGAPLVLSGQIGTGTAHAIGLFNAVVSFDPVNPSTEEHFSSNWPIVSWLNDPNAPQWEQFDGEMRDGFVVLPGVDGFEQPEDWGTNWAVDIIYRAAALLGVDGPDLELRSASLPQGGDTPLHGPGDDDDNLHELGMQIDFEVPDNTGTTNVEISNSPFDGNGNLRQSGGITFSPFFKVVTPQESGQTTTYIATVDGPSFVVVKSNDSYVAADSTVVGFDWSTAVQAREAYGEGAEELLLGIEDLILDAPGYDSAAMRAQFEALRDGAEDSLASIASIYFNDPRFWAGGSNEIAGLRVEYRQTNWGIFQVNMDPPAQTEILSEPLQASILDGFRALVRVLAEWLVTSDLARNLPGLVEKLTNAGGDLAKAARSIYDLVELYDKLDASLIKPLEAYFSGETAPTRFGLIETLKNQSFNHGGMLWIPEVDKNFEIIIDAGNEIVFENIVFKGTRTVQTTPDLGDAAEALDISLDIESDTTIDLELAVDLAFSFGVDLTVEEPSPEAFFVSPARFTDSSERPLLSFQASASAGPDNNPIDLTARIGQLEAEVDSSTAILDFQLETEVTLNDPNDDGRVTVAEMLAGSLGDIVQVNCGTVSFDLNLPLTVTIGSIKYDMDGFVTSIDTDLCIDPDSFFDFPDVTDWFDFEGRGSDGSGSGGSSTFDFGRFTFFDGFDLLAIFDALAAWFEQFGQGPAFGEVDFSFLKNLRLPDIGDITLPDVSFDKLIDFFRYVGELFKGIKAELGVPTFGSVQDLVLGLPSFGTMDLEPTSGKLEFEVNFTHLLESLVADLDFSAGLGDLVNITTDGLLKLTPQLAASFVFGITLPESRRNLTTSTRFEELNNGEGVQGYAEGLDDVEFRLANGAAIPFNLDRISSTGQLMNAILEGSILEFRETNYFNTLETALDLNRVTSLSRVSGLAFKSGSDEHWFKFTLESPGTSSDRFSLVGSNLSVLVLELVDESGKSVRASVGDLPAITLEDLMPGEYFLRIDGGNFGNKYEIMAQIGSGEKTDELRVGESLAIRLSGEDNNLTFIDLTEGSFPFSIVALNNSTAAAPGLGLGIVGVDDDGDGVIAGSPLLSFSLADNFFIRNFQMTASVELEATGIDALADLQFVNLGIQDGTTNPAQAIRGDGKNEAQLTVSAKDPEKEMTFGEIWKSVSEPEVDLFNVVESGQLELILPAVIRPLSLHQSLVSPDANPRIEVTWSDLFDFSTLGAELVDFPAVDNLKGLAFEKVIEALRELQDAIDGFENNDLFNQKIILLEQSINDLVDLSDQFGLIVDEIEAILIPDLLANRVASPDGGWSGNENTFTHVPGAASDLSYTLPSGTPLIAGKTYVLEFALDNRNGTAGELKLVLDNGDSETPDQEALVLASGEGEQTVRRVSVRVDGATAAIALRASADFDGTISNIRLREVGKGISTMADLERAISNALFPGLLQENPTTSGDWSLSGTTATFGAEVGFTITEGIDEPGYVPVNLQFDPLAAIDWEADTISFSINHGLSEGDELIFFRDFGSSDITGLIDGQTYRASVVDEATIKLKASDTSELIDLTNANGPGNTLLYGLNEGTSLLAGRTYFIEFDLLERNGQGGQLVLQGVLEGQEDLVLLAGGEQLPGRYKVVWQQGQDASALQILASADFSGIIDNLLVQQRSVTFEDDVLAIEFDYEKWLDEKLDEKVPLRKDVPLNLELEPLRLDALNNKPTNLVSGSGLLEVAYLIDLDFDFALNVSDPFAPEFYLRDSSSLKLGAGIKSEGLAFNVGFGGLGMFIKNGSVRLDNGTEIVTEANGQSIRPQNLATWELDLAPGIEDPANPGAAGEYHLLGDVVDNLQTTLTGQLDVSLPTFSPTESDPIGQFALSVPDLDVFFDALLAGNVEAYDPVLSPEGQFSYALPNFEAALESFLEKFENAWQSITSGWDAFLTFLETAVDEEVFGVKLPLVGDQLKDVAAFISDLRGVTDFLNDPTNADSKTQQELRRLLFEKLGPDDLNWLKDGNGDKAITIEDIVITQTADNLQIDMLLGQVLALSDLDVDFDLGLPGLGLDVDGKVQLELGFEFALSFGINKVRGFYFATDKELGPKKEPGPDNEPVPDRKNELSISLKATIPQFNANGNLVFMEVNVTDRDTLVGGDINIDLLDGGDGDGRLYLSELTNPSNKVVAANLDVNARVHLHLLTRFDSSARFPQIRTDLIIDWDFTGTEGGRDTSSVPTIQFDKVAVNAGTFINDLVGPILDEINAILDPIREPLEFITEPLPILKDLGMRISLLDIARIYGGSEYKGVIDFIEAAADLARLVDTFSAINEQNGWIEMASLQDIDFSLDGAAALDSRMVGELLPLDSLMNPIGLDGVDSKLNALLDKGAGGYLNDEDFLELRFPLFENPKLVFDLLLGRNVDLVVLDLPKFVLNFPWQLRPPIPIFPPWPVFLKLSAHVGAFADLSFGFDTAGLRTYFENGQSDPSDILDGFYIADLDARGRDRPEFGVRAGFAAAAELNIAVAAVGVGGGIFANIDLNLNDPDGDGKVRWSELERNFSVGPLYIFDVSGAITFELSAYLKIGFDTFFFGFVTIYKNKISWSQTLLDWNLPRPNTTPVLASNSGGTLTLHMGDYAARRKPGGGGKIVVNAEDGDENFRVLPGPSPDSVIVRAFGVEQTYSGVSKIQARAGKGNDSIFIDPNVIIPADLHGGSGNDELIAGGGVTRLFGGEGNDILIGGNSSDQLYGGPGFDQLTGSRGDDLLEGGENDDDIQGGPGDDILRGFGGADQLDGGLGNDLLEGGDGEDTLIGGSGDDVLRGGMGNDILVGNRGADLLEGGEGNDDLQGDENNDILVGGAGDDILSGGRDSDIIWGDDMEGSLSGNDIIWGGPGNDRLYGGFGNDLIFGGVDIRQFTTPVAGAGNDWIVGGFGSDIIYAGNDGAGSGVDTENTIFGDLEDASDPGEMPDDLVDTIYGDSGDDSIFAGLGDDQIFGLGGDDFILAGDGNDTVVAGGGRDMVYGGRGDDILYGETGGDFLIGELGNDRLDGGSGDDVLWGGSAGLGAEAFERSLERIRNGAFESDDEWALTAGSEILSNQGIARSNSSGRGALVQAIETTPGIQYTVRFDVDSIAAGEGWKLAAGRTSFVSDLDVIGVGTTEGAYAISFVASDSTTFIKLLAGNSLGAEVVFDNVSVRQQFLANPSFTADEGWIASSNSEIAGGAGIVRSSSDVSGTLWQAVTLLPGQDYELTLDVLSTSGLWSVELAALPDGTGAQVLVDWNTGTGSVQAPLTGSATTQYLILKSAPSAGAETRFGLTSLIQTTDQAFELPMRYAEMEARFPTGYAAPRIVPAAVFQNSLGGAATDGTDVINGGSGNDWIFGGGDIDVLDGGPGNDYVDGGSGNDEVFGGPGDDVIRGGANSDVLHGDEGIDHVYGDTGADFLYGDAGDESGSTLGQRLFGGGGIDSLYAWSNLALTGTEIGEETQKPGDQLIGGTGGDWLYGNLRQEILVGEGGNDYLHGDYLKGPDYIRNPDADLVGANDRLYGGTGEDQLYGGGGDDILWGGADSDWLEGQNGKDTLYGGAWIDILVLDTNFDYDNEGGNFDGHFGNETEGDVPDDNATDILQIQGTQGHDTIEIGQFAADDPRLVVQINSIFPPAGVNTDVILSDVETTRSLEVVAEWKDDNGVPLVEQFRIAGFGGDDTIGFVDGSGLLEPLDIGALASRGVTVKDFIGVIDGGPGDDVLTGTSGRDRLDGGEGSDILFGLGGDDRLWGDDGVGNPGDLDVLYAGQGNDDLIGGSGTNKLYAWSADPQGEPFGIFLRDDTGALLLDDEGNPVPEDTGLNRMIGGLQADELYGGTGLDFLYGNGGDDTLYTRDGVPFEDLEEQFDEVGEWKAYAKSTNQVWYYGGTNLDDIIRVDFVTEPGLIAEHHLITRLTENNGNFTFDAEVQLDFFATDGDGNRIWDQFDNLFGASGLGSTDAETRSTSLATAADESRKPVEDRIDALDLVNSILPPESDFLAIIIDALDGDDEVIVGPTVTKTVWIDGGPGDDYVEIASGFPILIDQTEKLELRNDSLATAYPLTYDPANPESYLPIGESTIFSRLTIDNPDDIDNYLFTLDSSLEIQPGDAILLNSLGITDLLSFRILERDGNGEWTLEVAASEDGRIELHNGTGSNLETGKEYLLQVTSDRTPTRYELHFDFLATPDAGERDQGNNNEVDAYEIANIQFVELVTGLNLSSRESADVDWFVFEIPEGLDTAGSLPGQAIILRDLDGSGLSLKLLDEFGNDVDSVSQGSVLYLTGLPAGQYFIEVTGGAGRYELATSIGPSGYQTVDLSGATIVDLSSEIEILRRDVLLGGIGNDVLIGGPYEEWIFGGEGNDVLAGGYDKQASDLLWGGPGDDIFQILPDGLPLLNDEGRGLTGDGETFVPTLVDRLDGGEGEDQVLFLGGDLDEQGRAVPDHVAIRYNTILHRYELTALVWDTANQRFLTEAAFGGDQFVQHYAFYQVTDIEQTVFDTQAGDDVVHGDPGYILNGSEWGMAPQARPQGATIASLTIFGGDGNDVLFGGAEDDFIDGGDGNDYISGGEGNDELFGGPGDDLISGNQNTPTDTYEWVLRNGLTGRNDEIPFAAFIGEVSESTAIQATFTTGDKGDWYLFKTPSELAGLSGEAALQHIRDAISVTFEDKVQDNLFKSDFYADHRIEVEAAAFDGGTVQVLENPETAPEYFLVRIRNVASFGLLGNPLVIDGPLTEDFVLFITLGNEQGTERTTTLVFVQVPDTLLGDGPNTATLSGRIDLLNNALQAAGLGDLVSAAKVYNEPSIRLSTVDGRSLEVSFGSNLIIDGTFDESGNAAWTLNDESEVNTFVELVRDIDFGSASSDPRNLTVFGEWLYFDARDGSNRELWRTDGGGPEFVKVTSLGSPAVFGEWVYFSAWEEVNGTELWRTDGGEPELVKDINPGIASSKPADLTIVGERLYFRAKDGDSGTELWLTDGGEPELVKDINPGSASSTPLDLTVFGEWLYFDALVGSNRE